MRKAPYAEASIRQRPPPGRPLRLVLIAIVLASCQKSPTEPTDNPPVEGPARSSEGVLLSGTSTARAVEAVVTRRQSPADPGHKDGFVLTSRLEAWIAPDATVAELNGALMSTDARIVGMTRGDPLVSLSIEPVEDADATEMKAQEVHATGAFLLVVPGMAVAQGPAAIPASTVATRIEPAAGPIPWHLARGRAPAAWNARDGALAGGHEVPVLIADAFSALNPHPEIPAMRFPDGIEGTAQAGQNHGWHVAGTIAADFSGSDAVGVHPDANALLDVMALPIGGLSWSGILDELLANTPTSGNFVINTSLRWAYSDSVAAANGGNWTTHTLLTGFMMALKWRREMSGESGRFVHATAAGNEGLRAGNMKDARLTSPWTIAHSFDDLREIFPAGSLTPTQQAGVEAAWAVAASLTPWAVTRMPNVVLVGSSDALGNKSDFSDAPATVRAVGEDVLNACLAPNNACIGNLATLSGTSMATPQIAGAAAWMWNLRPDWTSAELRSRIVNAYVESDRPGVIDHYVLTLSGDPSLTDAPIRQDLLDVAGNSVSPGSNARFDEYDLELFIDFFESFEIARAGGSDSDYSRYDLNGDEMTGGGTAASFDLDVNPLPAFESVSFDASGTTLVMDELLLTDLEVLCYYAYSNLYDGDTARRAELMVDCVEDPQPPLEIEVVEWLSEMPPSVTNTLTVLVRRGADPVDGADVTLMVSGGAATLPSGLTDAQGQFTSGVTLASGSETVSVEIEVSDAGQTASTTVESAAVPVGVVTGLRMGATVAAGSTAGGERDAPPNFSYSDAPPIDLAEIRSTEASASDSFGNSASHTAVATLNVQIDESSSGGVAAYHLDGSTSALASADGGIATGAAHSNIQILFRVTGGSVPYRLSLSVEPPTIAKEPRVKFLGPIAEEFDERPDSTFTRDLTGVLPPGDYELTILMNVSASANRSRPTMSDSAGMTVDLLFGGGG